MKKQALFLLLLVMAALSAQAQLLWKVSKPGSDKTTYLFGTHHFAPLSVIDNMPLADLIAQADEIYGELSLDEMNSLAANPALAAAMMAPADSTLDKVFTPAELSEITSTLQQTFNEPMMPMIIQQMNPMKPAALDMVIAQLAVAKLMPDFDMTKQLDKTLLQMGADASKPVKGLETAASQLNALFGGSIRQQAESLLKGLRSNKNTLDEFTKLTDLYLAGNLTALAAMTAESMTADQQKKMIDDRNDAWIDFMLGMLPTTSMFIICGAGHLGGDKGLINQLRNNGYTVEPAI